MRNLTRLSLAIVAALVALGGSSASADWYRGANAKSLGKFGVGFDSGSSRAVRSYRAVPAYAVAPAPQVVRVMPSAPPVAPQIAAAPTERRSFSVDPGAGVVSEAAPVYRQAPVFRSRGSGMPTYMLPKADPRKHGG